MAQKRMFDKTLIDSDLFIDLPIPSQCLYFHLSMRADDEGFVGNVKGILRLIGFKDEDLRPLVDRKFILIFQTGVIVIRHWKINNYLRNDRCKATNYKNEKMLLKENTDGVYALKNKESNTLVYQQTTSSIPSIEENSIDKISIEENDDNNYILTNEEEIIGDIDTVDEAPYQPKPSIKNIELLNFILGNFKGKCLTPIEIELVDLWEDNDLTRYAIRETVLNQIYSVKYINTILQDFKNNNVTTVEEAQRKTEEYKNKKDKKMTISQSVQQEASERFLRGES